MSNIYFCVKRVVQGGHIVNTSGVCKTKYQSKTIN